MESQQQIPKNWTNLLPLRRSDTCVFLGSGSSINRITDAQWAWIAEQDSWTVNNWIYHDFFVPDFYHIEVKWYDYELMKRRLLEKQEQYCGVNFIFPRGKTIKMLDNRRLLLHEVVFAGARKFDYPMVGRDPKRTNTIFTAKYTEDRQCLTKSYDMSLTAVFEMICRLGYKEVVLFGVDLYNSYYFWTGGDPKYGEVHHQTNKSHEGKDPTNNHATYRFKEFVQDFNFRWMKPKGCEILVGHKDTALYPILGYKELP